MSSKPKTGKPKTGKPKTGETKKFFQNSVKKQMIIKKIYERLYKGHEIWGNRISGKKKAEAMNYHGQRYEAWLEYIDTNWPESITYHQIRQRHKRTNKNIWLPSNQWKKITIINKKEQKPYVVFDASFGSVAETSDFDVVVKCTEVAPLEKWITFLETWHEKHKGYIFTNYFDSNFYFEPSYMTSNKTLISFMNKRMISREMEPVHNNELKFLDAIKKYKDGYRTSTVVKHNYSSFGRRGFYPNPLGFEKPVPAKGTVEKEGNKQDNQKTKQQREIKQYTLMKDVNSKIIIKNSDFISGGGKGTLIYTAADIIDSAFTKTEGLIAPGSLAICKVFGDKTFTRYVIKHTPGAVSSWRLISAYEMLCNMQMHEHDNLIKTKYIGRFINSMPNYSGNCGVIARAIENTLKVKEIVSFSDKEHAKMEKWSTVSLLISALIDLMYKHEEQVKNGQDCNISDDSKSRARTLDDDLEIMYNMVIRKFGGSTKKNQAIAANKAIINSNSEPVMFQACVKKLSNVECKVFSETQKGKKGKNKTYHSGIQKARKISASKRSERIQANFTEKAKATAKTKKNEYMKELKKKIEEYMTKENGTKRTRKEARKLALTDLAKRERELNKKIKEYMKPKKDGPKITREEARKLALADLAKKNAIPKFRQFVLEF